VVFLTPQIILPDGTNVVLPDVPSESPLSSNTTRVPVSSAYSQVVRQRLHHFLTDNFRMASLPVGTAMVAFVLSRDGRVLGESQVTSPQGPPFIAAAKSALAQAQPFPPFPQGSEATEVEFTLAVEYAPNP
jgi:TonB family protein